MDSFNEFEKDGVFTALRDFCERNGVVVKYRKGEMFAEDGKVSKRWGIVTKGYFAYTVMDSSGNDRIIGFSFPDGIVGSYNSIINNIGSEAYIVALSDAEVVECNLSDLECLASTNGYELLFGIANSLYLDVLSRYADIYRKKPKERYLALITKCPEILQHITLGQLASYLMITQTHLSRIRKEISFEK